MEEDICCFFEYGFDIFGGKWKFRIICVLVGKGILWYSVFWKEISNIMDVVLLFILKELIVDDIVKRKLFDEILFCVEYCFIEKGNFVIFIL